MARHFAVSFALRLATLLPLGAARGLARSAAFLLQGINNRHRKIATVNIDLAYPELDATARRELVDRSLREALYTALEMPLVWQRDDRWLNDAIVRVENAAAMDAALAQGNGVLVICPHLGNWEVFGRYLPRHAPATNLYQPPRYAALEAVVKRGRERSGATLVPTSQRGVAALLKALQRGEIVGMLPDQVPKKNGGVFAPFFGVPAYTMTLVHKLLERTHCSAVMGYALREGDGFAIIFEKATEDLYSAEAEASAAALNRHIEAAARRDPAQYQWAYKRFKRQPDGSNPYAGI